MPPENTRTDKDAAREEVDRTVVMKDVPNAGSGGNSGTHPSDMIDGAPAKTSSRTS